MSEDNKENEETPKNEESEEESSEGEQETPQNPEPEKTDKSKEVQSLTAQKEHFRKKAEDAEKKATELEGKLPSSSTDQPTDPMEIIKLGKAVEGYSAEEIEFASRHSEDKSPNGLIKALEDDWVKDAIHARREKVKKEQSVPEPSSPAGSGEKSTKDMSREDHEKLFYENIKKQQGRGSGI